MRYLPCILLALGVSACAEHHDLTQCQGPYLALTPPPAPVAEAPKSVPVVVPATAPPLVPSKPAQQQVVR
jgi:hypothetical protein